MTEVRKYLSSAPCPKLQECYTILSHYDIIMIIGGYCKLKEHLHILDLMSEILIRGCH